MELDLEHHSTFRILPLAARNDNYTHLRIIREHNSDVRNLPTYKVLDEIGAYETLTKPSLLRFIDEQMPPAIKSGIKLVFLVEHEFQLNLNSLKENIKSGSILNLSKARLVEKLHFSLSINGNLIFDADCDTLSNIPRNIDDEVAKTIAETNPEISSDFIREHVIVVLKTLVPLDAINIDDEFAHLHGSVTGVVIDGFEIYQQPNWHCITK